MIISVYNFFGNVPLHSFFPLDSTPQILGHQQNAKNFLVASFDEKADQINDRGAQQNLRRLRTYYHKGWNDDDDDQLMNDRHLKSWVIRRQKKTRSSIPSIRAEYRRYLSEQELHDYGDHESDSRRILTHEAIRNAASDGKGSASHDYPIQEEETKTFFSSFLSFDLDRDTVPAFITKLCNIFNIATMCGFLAIVLLILFFGAIGVREAMEKEKSTDDRICTDA